jgi:hypothetical protein
MRQKADSCTATNNVMLIYTDINFAHRIALWPGDARPHIMAGMFLHEFTIEGQSPGRW